jgi:hypothetical protein
MRSSARAQRAKRVAHVPEVQIDGSVEYYDYEHDKRISRTITRSASASAR